MPYLFGHVSCFRATSHVFGQCTSICFRALPRVFGHCLVFSGIASCFRALPRVFGHVSCFRATSHVFVQRRSICFRALSHVLGNARLMFLGNACLYVFGQCLLFSAWGDLRVADYRWQIADSNKKTYSE